MTEATRDLFETLARVLLRCWIIGVVMQIMVIGAVLGMGEVIYEWHRALYGLSNHETDLLTSGSAAMLKLCVGIFFFVPWLAIWLILHTKQD